jgi:hypothetical protein
MPRFDASSAECLVFTFKEGLLSPIAHDLKIRVTRFTINVDERSRRIRARFESDSLRVVCAVQSGKDAPGTLSDKDKAQIEANIARDVLNSKRYPRIELVSASVEERGGGFVVKAALALHGTTRDVVFPVRKRGKNWIAEATVHQPDFGIRPYSALLGTLKVRADVKVRVAVPDAQA